MIGAGGHLLVDYLEHAVGRDYIQQGQFPHPLGMILGQPVGNPGSPVVADQEKGVEAQLLHHFYLVLRHSSLGVGQVLRIALGLAAVPVSPQIGGDHRKVFGQSRRYFVPYGMGLRVAVEQ